MDNMNRLWWWIFWWWLYCLLLSCGYGGGDGDSIHGAGIKKHEVGIGWPLKWPMAVLMTTHIIINIPITKTTILLTCPPEASWGSWWWGSRSFPPVWGEGCVTLALDTVFRDIAVIAFIFVVSNIFVIFVIYVISLIFDIFFIYVISVIFVIFDIYVISVIFDFFVFFLSSLISLSYLSSLSSWSSTIRMLDIIAAITSIMVIHTEPWTLEVTWWSAFRVMHSFI